GQLPLASHQRVRRNGKVRRVQALQRGEVAVAELVDPLRRGQILEAVIAEVSQALCACKLTRRPGNEDLAAVPGRGDARGAVHVDADVALVREQRLPGVETHPHADGASSGSMARLGRRIEGIRGLRYGEEEGVNLRIHLHPAVSGERAT